MYRVLKAFISTARAYLANKRITNKVALAQHKQQVVNRIMSTGINIALNRSARS